MAASLRETWKPRLAALGVHLAPVAGDATVDVEVSLTDELKALAAESLIQPGHDLTLLGKTESGKELVVVGGEGACVPRVLSTSPTPSHDGSSRAHPRRCRPLATPQCNHTLNRRSACR